MSTKVQPEIIFEDDDIIIVNKPPFYLTIPDRFAPEKKNLYGWLTEKFGKIFIVHRLDKETSGILMFAKNGTAHRTMSMRFEDRKVTKIYQTLLDGVVHLDEGTIEKPIAMHKNGKRMLINRRGKMSITDYKVLKRYKNFTLVDAHIRTGRMHQIRIHFESIGYPLAVDAIYGRREGFLLSEIKRKKYKSGKDHEERPLISRVILHARKLEFKHPTTNETMTFEAELPKDFRAVVNQLDKWG